MTQPPLQHLRAELEQATTDPWLPIETKLVSWSLGIGITLLVLLAWIARSP